nr:non-canonical poly(a) rna polymerase protein trf4-1 [Quercus suber]
MEVPPRLVFSRLRSTSRHSTRRPRVGNFSVKPPMQCLRRALCTAPHAYDATQALLSYLAPALQRRLQSSTSFAVNEEEAHSTAAVDQPQRFSNSHKLGRIPTSRQLHPASFSLRRVRGEGEHGEKNEVTGNAVASVESKQPQNLQAWDIGMRKLLHPDIVKHVAKWEADPYTNFSWQQRMQVIAQTMACLQNRKDGKPIDDVPQILREYIDYEEKGLTPKHSRMTPALPVPWKLSASDSSSNLGLGRLDREIKAFVKHMECTPAENAGRQRAIEEVLAFIRQSTTPNARNSFKAELFGSEKTGLALATSDIDIRLYRDVSTNDEQSQQAQQNAARSFMARLARLMVKSRQFGEIFLRRSASYPIINTTHLATGIEIQLVASDSSAVREGFVKKYLGEMPHLRELYFLVRTILSTRGLLDVFNGGLGSYATFMWVTAIVRTKHFKNNIGEYGDDSIASHFLAFLRFVAGMNSSTFGLVVQQGDIFNKHDYSIEQLQGHITRILANPRRTDVSKAHLLNQVKLAQRSALQPYKLCLQDPADPANDLGRKCHAYKHIRFALNVLYTRLRFCLREIDSALQEGVPPPTYVLLEPMVGRVHEVDFRRRNFLGDFGEQALEHRRVSGLHASQRLNIMGPGRLYAI